MRIAGAALSGRPPRRRLAPTLAAVLLAGVGTRLFAQPATLVRDINQTVITEKQGLMPSQGVVAGGVLYFNGSDEASGRELWRSDGTEEGTRILIDMLPGPSGTGSGSALPLGNAVLFVGNDGSGWDIWRTDGTAAGASRVTAGRWSSAPQVYGAFGTIALFTVADPTFGYELWITDGTPAGTRLVKDIRAGAEGSMPSWPVMAGPWIYFTANDGTTGYELWRTDGTEAGTSLVRDIHPSGHAGTYAKVAVNGQIFFVAEDGTHGSELWKSDGTAAGTVLVKDIRPGAFGSSPRLGQVLGGRLFFWAYEETAGSELWTTDGQESNTQLFADIVPGPGSAAGFYMIRLGTLLLFDANQVLWRTDGTVAGTRRVVPSGGPQSPGSPVLTANGVYWRVRIPFGDVELWRTDGTEGGTVRIAVIGSTTSTGLLPQMMVAFADGLAYGVDSNGGTDLWYHDADEIRPLRTRGAWATSSQPGSVASINGHTLFVARDERGRELWETDATAKGTTLLRDFCVGCPETLSPYSGPYLGPIVDGRRVLGAADPDHGFELWMTDGTAAGTTLALDLAPGPAPSGPSFAIVHEGWLYFTAYPNGYGFFRWRPGEPPVRIDDTHRAQPVSLGRHVIYGSDELHRTDGSPEGTVLVKDIRPGEYPSGPHQLARFRGDVFFQAFTDETGYETWKTDGTGAGTRLVKDVCPGPAPCDTPNGAYPFTYPTPGPDALYFVYSDGVAGRELWKTDGTPEGTVMVRDIHPAGSSDPFGLVEMNGRLYFTTNDGVHGRELWTTDGTTAGTTMVKDISPGPGHGIPASTWPVDVGGVLLLAGHRKETGAELWRSDGTEAGTYALQDIAPGPGSSMPYVLGRVGSRIYLSANDGRHGRELFSLVAPPRFSVEDVTVSEGGNARFAVRVEGATAAPLVLSYQTADLTATSSADYAPAAGLLTFSAATPSHAVDVAIMRDAAQEPLEVFALDLSVASGSGGPRTTRAEASIVDDDAPSVAASAASVPEGDTGSSAAAVRVELRTRDGQATTHPVAISYESVASTATAGLDFTATQGALTFPAGTPSGASQMATTPVLGDTIDEPDEVFQVRLVEQTSTNVPQTSSVRILDDDGAPATDQTELAHGAAVWSSLAAAGAAADRDWYFVKQQPYASYEIVVDAPSGDVQPVTLHRLAPDGVTVLATGSPVGTGSAFSLRWWTGQLGAVSDEKIMVASGDCGVDCGADDVYRVRAYETTASIARYVNEGPLKTFVVLQNPTNEPIRATVTAWRTDGSSPTSTGGGTIPPRGSTVQQIHAILSGSLTVAHDGPYGALVGKAVTVNTSNGFSFDTPMTYRPR